MGERTRCGWLEDRFGISWRVCQRQTRSWRNMEMKSRGLGLVRLGRRQEHLISKGLRKAFEGRSKVSLKRQCLVTKSFLNPPLFWRVIFVLRRRQLLACRLRNSDPTWCSQPSSSFFLLVDSAPCLSNTFGDLYSKNVDHSYQASQSPRNQD